MEIHRPRDRKGGARCLVFGGSGSLGREVCSQLHRSGAQVVFTYFRGEKIARDLELHNPGLRGRQLDLSQTTGIGELVAQVGEELGGLDAIIHAAAVGIAHPTGKPFDEFPTAKAIHIEQWDHLMAVNLRSVFLACQALPEAMSKEGGNLVFLGSIDGTKPVPAPLHYAASKGALSAVTRALAKELKEAQIRVNTVVPGVMNQGLSSTLPQAHREEYLKHTSAKRLGTTVEVGALVVWLALDNTYINGQSLVVDGGL